MFGSGNLPQEELVIAMIIHLDLQLTYVDEPKYIVYDIFNLSI